MIILRQKTFSETKENKLKKTLGAAAVGTGAGAGLGYAVSKGAEKLADRYEHIGDHLRIEKVDGNTIIMRKPTDKLYKLGDKADKIVKPVSKFVRTKKGKIVMVSTAAIGTGYALGKSASKREE